MGNLMILKIKASHGKSFIENYKKVLIDSRQTRSTLPDGYGEPEKIQKFNRKYIKILLFFLFFSLAFFQKAHTETTRTRTTTQSHHHISPGQSDCQSRFAKNQCQKMINASPEVPREYFLNCSETNKQVRVTCLKAARESVVVEAITGSVFYGAAKGLGVLGISTATALGATAGVVVIGGVGYAILKGVESADKSCRKKNTEAMKTAWLIFASYHNKELADSYERSKTCSKFLSDARRKTRNILYEIREKKRKQKEYEEQISSIKNNPNLSPTEKERKISIRSRRPAKTVREVTKNGKKFLAALKFIENREPEASDDKDLYEDIRKLASNYKPAWVDEDKKKQDFNISEEIARLKRRYQCSSGQYLAKVACGNIAAIGSIITGGVGAAVAKRIIQKRIRQRAWERSLTPDDRATLTRAREVLGETYSSLTKKQKEALLKAHQVGRGQTGKNGKPASVENYTRKQIREKARILARAGFPKKQREQLIRRGVVGDHEGFKRGQEIVLDRSGGGVSRGTVIDFGDDGWVKVEVPEGTKWIHPRHITDPSPSFEIGSKVRIPRSDGRIQYARIAEVSDNGRSFTVHFEDYDSKGKLVTWKRPVTRDQVNSLYHQTASQKPASRRGKRYKSKIVSEYEAKSGAIVHADPYDSHNKAFLSWSKGKIDGQLRASGIKPEDFNPDNPIHKEKLFGIWLRSVVPDIEDYRPKPREPDTYGNARNRIIKNQGGRASVGEIAMNQAAVCRELSVCGNVVFAEYGIHSKVISGELPGGGRHAWVEVVDPKTGEVLNIVDNNLTQDTHPDYQDYLKAITGRELMRDIDITNVKKNVVAEPVRVH